MAARSLAMLDARKQPRSTVDIWHCCVAQTRFDYSLHGVLPAKYCGERTDETLLLSASMTAPCVLVKSIFRGLCLMSVTDN